MAFETIKYENFIEKIKKGNLFLDAFKATHQQEDYFMLMTMSKLNITSTGALVFRVLLRNHAYSPNLKLVWIGKSKVAVIPEPYQLSTHMGAISKLLNLHRNTIERVFKKLTEAKLLLHKKTKSGHLRYFVNTIYCQELLEEWETEDRVFGTTDYTISTIMLNRKNKAKKALKEKEEQEQEAMQSKVETSNALEQAENGLESTIEDIPKARRGRKRRTIAEPKVKEPIVEEEVAVIEEPKVKEPIVEEEVAVIEEPIVKEPLSEIEEANSFSLYMDIVDELDNTKDYPPVTTELIDKYANLDHKWTKMLGLDGFIAPSVLGLGLLVSDLLKIDDENKLNPENQFKFIKSLVAKFGDDTKRVTSIVHKYTQLAEAKGVKLDLDDCVECSTKVALNGMRVDYTTNCFNIMEEDFILKSQNKNAKITTVEDAPYGIVRFDQSYLEQTVEVKHG